MCIAAERKAFHRHPQETPFPPIHSERDKILGRTILLLFFRPKDHLGVLSFFFCFVVSAALFYPIICNFVQVALLEGFFRVKEKSKNSPEFTLE